MPDSCLVPCAVNHYTLGIAPLLRVLNETTPKINGHSHERVESWRESEYPTADIQESLIYVHCALQYYIWRFSGHGSFSPVALESLYGVVGEYDCLNA